MDFSKIDFLNDFYERLLAVGYSNIEIFDKNDGVCKRVNGRMKLLDDGEFCIRYTTPFVNCMASHYSILLTEAEIVHIPHDVSLDFVDLEKYFGRYF